MDYPMVFPLYERLAKLSPDTVRQYLSARGFSRQHGGGSEIWAQLSGHGYAVVRIDAQGHAKNPGQLGGYASPPWGAGRVPHYHKEWVPADLFETYLTGYVSQTVSYDDNGTPVLGPMNDRSALRTHIRR
jgi:hypothetical protein